MPYKDPEKQRLAVRAANKRYREAHGSVLKARTGTFIGVDGEGGGKDELSRQNYLLLRAGDHLLFNANKRLTSDECFSFIAGLPMTGINYVSYFFDYDVTQILRDVPYAKICELFKRRVPKDPLPGEEHGVADTIFWDEYEIGYFPRKHLKVRRIGRANPDKKKLAKIPWVTIHDVGSFFQCSFVKACSEWGVITPQDIALIKADKDRRDIFDLMTEREITYNKREVDALALLMERFREVCIETDYMPRQWEGPGYLASAMMTKHGVTKTKQIAPRIPPDCWHAANDAYYGGRFEIFKVGHVEGVQEYDICSAYPTSYLSLPCLEHGKWSHNKGRPTARSKVSISRVRYSHREESPIVCNLPCRLKTGALRWQREGQGWYWNVEIEAAKKAGTIIREYYESWSLEQDCHCSPFGSWVTDVYKKRQEIGKGTRGVPIKLALNSIYGKCCQSIGHPPFANPIWAGLITAVTRVRLIEAYAPIDPERLVMLATDGVYVTGELPHLASRIGKGLGDWELGKSGGIFVIKPGMYAWDGGEKVKTRGVPKEVFDKLYPMMYKDFTSHWLDLYRLHTEQGMPWGLVDTGNKLWPEFPMPQKLFIGQRLAVHLNKPDKAGVWTNKEVTHSFDPSVKRRAGNAHPTQSYVTTLAHLGSPTAQTVPYNKAIGVQNTPKETREEMRDVISREPFVAQLGAQNFAMLISDMPQEKLFDDDDAIPDLGAIE